MITWPKMTRTMGGRAILLVLFAVILLHMSMMMLSLRDSRLAHQTAKRDEIIQKIINAIFLVEATPQSDRKHAVEAMEDPDLHVTLTPVPKTPLQFHKIAFWEINKALNDKLDSFAISIYMAPNQWLNLKATVYAHLVTNQLVLFAIEIIVFIAIFISAWSVMRFTEPLKNFKQMAERLGFDLNAEPVNVSGPAVVKDAAKAMNVMQKRIQEMIHGRTQMLAAISHDLRTPITRMKLRCQFLDEKTSNSFVDDLDEMQAMINETMSFARDDAAKEEKRLIDLVSLLDTMCQAMRELHPAINFKSEIHRLPLMGRSIALKRAFQNLLNNAVRFGDQVTVHLQKRGNNAVVIIEDDGPGIPEADLEQVFAPFYRSESSRSRDTGGVGLGLAVTRDIIEAHTGRIKLKNIAPHGLRVTVLLSL